MEVEEERVAGWIRSIIRTRELRGKGSGGFEFVKVTSVGDQASRLYPSSYPSVELI